MLEAFEMHRIDVGHEHRSLTMQDKGLTLMKHLDHLDNNEDTDDCETVGEETVP